MHIKATIVAYAFSVQCFENTTIVAYVGLRVSCLCDMWRCKWQICGYPPAPTLPPYRSATGIGYASKTTI